MPSLHKVLLLGNLTLDLGPVAFRTPLTSKLPAGSSVYDQSVAGTIGVVFSVGAGGPPDGTANRADPGSGAT